MIFITNLPSFYKINLYNKISIKKNIKVFFLGKKSKFRNNNFSTLLLKFENYFSYQGNYESRNKFLSCISIIIYLLKNKKEKKIILTGWNEIEYWICLFFPFRKKILILETNLNYTNKNFFKIFLKKIFLYFIHTCVVCGKSQQKLLKLLNFNKNILKSKGVGIINKNIKSRNFDIKKYNKKIVYIGRFDQEEKNILWLIDFFKKHPNFELDLIGYGPLKSQIVKKIVNIKNIKCLKSVKNRDLSKVFKKYCFLILPSLKEAWGLVVEEALYFNTPVLVSKNCGVSEIVKNGVNGYIFNTNESSLSKILQKINQKNYEKLKPKINYFNSDDHQIKTYLKL